mmetsp:Transcript_18533/g.60375  ORF Transcript_18533/g.60375 Transcript_18533/m.60375 type:complete len:166 (-) Transcript_18533:1603-2100(-)
MALSCKLAIARGVHVRRSSRSTRGRGGVLRCNAGVSELLMPALSSTMTEGKIVNWLVEEGDSVSKGDAIVVVESDKADMDVESFDEGILAAIVVGDGEIAQVGSPIAYIAASEADVAEAQAKAGGAAAAAPAPAPAPTPDPATFEPEFDFPVLGTLLPSHMRRHK